MTLAPIAIFTYRRTHQLTQTLNALECCAEFSNSPVFVFSDGPKDELSEKDVADVRAVIRGRLRPNMQIVEASQNVGLAASIIKGVSTLCARYGRVIVIEDDLVAAPATLTWFNTALDAYADAAEVFHINAYQHYIPEFRNIRCGVFGRFVGSWGWATWQRAWQHFDPAATGWARVLEDEHLRRSFDQNDTFPLSEMLVAQMRGRSDSWAIRWFWSCFKARAKTLSPPRSLIANIGFDQKATHNSVGLLKYFSMPKTPLMWKEVAPPELPFNRTILLTNEQAKQRALLKTRAKRNAMIKRYVRKPFVAMSGHPLGFLEK